MLIKYTPKPLQSPKRIEKIIGIIIVPPPKPTKIGLSDQQAEVFINTKRANYSYSFLRNTFRKGFWKNLSKIF